MKELDKIESFQVNHENLQRGIFVSRKDYDEEDKSKVIATTFDIRMKLPNREPVMNMAEMHTIEHLGATFLRNHPDYKKKTIYFGPMGCRTGFYLIFKGDVSSKEMITPVTKMYEFIAEFYGDIPGADPKSCGNYLDQNLPMARYEAQKLISNTLSKMEWKNLNYPKE